jgi:hypothetical protein
MRCAYEPPARASKNARQLCRRAGGFGRGALRSLVCESRTSAAQIVRKTTRRASAAGNPVSLLLKCKASTRCASGSLFFEGPKKSNQKKGPFPRGSNSPLLKRSRGLSDSASCLGGKRRRSMCAALRVSRMRGAHGDKSVRSYGLSRSNFTDAITRAHGNNGPGSRLRGTSTVGSSTAVSCSVSRSSWPEM